MFLLLIRKIKTSPVANPSSQKSPFQKAFLPPPTAAFFPPPPPPPPPKKKKNCPVGQTNKSTTSWLRSWLIRTCRGLLRRKVIGTQINNCSVQHWGRNYMCLAGVSERILRKAWNPLISATPPQYRTKSASNMCKF